MIRIRALGPTVTEDILRTELQSILAENLDWKHNDQLGRIRKKLANLSDGLSQTARLKQDIGQLTASSRVS